MIFSASWPAILITVLAVVGYIYEWPIEALAPALVVILVAGMVAAATGAKEKELERSSLRLRELAGYFARRFAGNSSLSIFAIIDGLYSVDNPQLWDWARACDMSQRIFNSWCDGFISRVQSDTRTRRFTIYLRTYLNELWLLTSHYHEFVEQFHEVAGKLEVPLETVDQYNRFATEYNAFVQHLREQIVALKKIARTEIEPPSVKMAQELPVTRTVKPVPHAEDKPPRPAEHKGYIM